MPPPRNRNDIKSMKPIEPMKPYIDTQISDKEYECPACGATAPGDSTVCPECGEEFEGVEEEVRSTENSPIFPDEEVTSDIEHTIGIPPRNKAAYAPQVNTGTPIPPPNEPIMQEANAMKSFWSSGWSVGVWVIVWVIAAITALTGNGFLTLLMFMFTGIAAYFVKRATVWFTTWFISFIVTIFSYAVIISYTGLPDITIFFSITIGTLIGPLVGLWKHDHDQKERYKQWQLSVSRIVSLLKEPRERGANLSIVDDYVAKAFMAGSLRNYEKSLEYSKLAEGEASSINKKYNDAVNAVNNAEQLTVNLNRIMITETAENILRQSQKLLLENKYEESSRETSLCVDELERLKVISAPSLTIEETESEFVDRKWDNMIFNVKNSGNAAALNINIKLDGPIEVRRSSTIDFLGVGETKQIECLIRFDGWGSISVEVQSSYQNAIQGEQGGHLNYESSHLFEVLEKGERLHRVERPQIEVEKQQFDKQPFRREELRVESPPIEVEKQHFDKLDKQPIRREELRVERPQIEVDGSRTSMEPLDLIYEIKEKIGSGGYATVRKAIRKADRKLVAVKIPKIAEDGETISNRIMEDFEKEASIWAKLEHPNIVELYGFGTKPYPWLAMELMEGGCLREMPSDTDVGFRLEIAIEILNGLFYAHHMGVAHRDIKPENILFTEDGVPKITDWGIAKAMLSKTMTSEQRYTIAYAAPEQIAPKKFGRPDWRSDIWGSGVVIYEMLTLKLPFSGEDIHEIMSNILESQPTPPTSLNSELPREIDAVILKALYKNVNKRYDDIGQFRNELQEIYEMIK